MKILKNLNGLKMVLDKQQDLTVPNLSPTTPSFLIIKYDITGMSCTFSTKHTLSVTVSNVLYPSFHNHTSVCSF